MNNLQTLSSSRCEISEKCLSNIEQKKIEIEESVATCKQKIESFLIDEEEKVENNTRTIQGMLSHILQEQSNFEANSMKKIDTFKVFATNFINDLKKVGI